MTELEIEYRELEDSLLFATPEEESRARRAFALKIAKKIEEQPSRADLHHKYALCLYEIANWSDDDKRKIEYSFQRAITLDHDSIFSRIFLTHFYYDIQRYRESIAENCAEECRESENVPVWRTCKMYELRLCCQLLLNRISKLEFEKSVDQLHELLSLVDDDILETAWPNELITVLKGNNTLKEEVDDSKLEWLELE